MEDNVYSYHTFLYPFLWEGKDGSHSIQTFEDQIDLTDWSPDDMVTSDNKLTSVLKNGTPEEQRLDYQAFQYFNPAARKSLFRCDGEIVHGRKFRVDDVHNKGEYRIYTIGSGKSSEKFYLLHINHIKLRLFNTGIGILVFELEYHLPETGDINALREQARKDIRNINEYGRRVYPEYLPYAKTGDGSFEKNLCASRIELAFGNTVLSENIKLRSEAHMTGKGENYLNDPDHKNSFIRKLLLKENSHLKITPAIDDRMFVCCCLCDANYPSHFLGHPAFPDDEYICERQHSRWKYLSDWKIGKELYGLINVDRGDPSCMNRKMLDQYLEEQLYLRWFEWGTMHAVTNHSMFCITSPGVKDEVINPFLIEYVQLCILVIAQRASLIAFDERITTAISDKRKTQDEKNDEVLALSKDFAIFQGQILIPEATSQIQGIELYEKLQKMLFIEKLEQNILNQMKNLFEVAEYEQAEQQEKQQESTEIAFNLLAILAIASACTDAYDFILKREQDLFLWRTVLAVVLGFAAFAIVSLVMKPIKWMIKRIQKRWKRVNQDKKRGA